MRSLSGSSSTVMLFESPDLNLGDELLNFVGTGRSGFPRLPARFGGGTSTASASLLTSVSLGYPVGVVLATRLVPGVDGVPAGQACGAAVPLRVATTDLALPVARFGAAPFDTEDTRKKRLERWFFLTWTRQSHPFLSPSGLTGRGGPIGRPEHTLMRERGSMLAGARGTWTSWSALSSYLGSASIGCAGSPAALRHPSLVTERRRPRRAWEGNAMQADTVDVKTLFDRDIRYLIPVFQRNYKWNESEHWAPLWVDLRNLATDLLEFGPGPDLSEHFLERSSARSAALVEMLKRSRSSTADSV